MLHTVRQHKQSFVIWAILGVVIFVFVFWGVEAVVSGPGVNSVAMVGEVAIEPLEVQRAEYNLVQSYRGAYKDQFTPEMREALNLRQQALNGLIDRAVLAQQAEKLGLEISDAELRDVIVGNPSFHSDGRFDKELYVRALRYSRMTPADYEEARRRDLSIQRLQRLIEDGVTVGDEAVRDAVLDQLETRTFRYVKLPTSEFEAEVQVDDEEAVKATYEKFKDKYKTPEMVRASMLVFSPEAHSSEVEIAEEEVTEFYEDNKAGRFTQPHEVSARHILIKVEAGAGDEAKQEARKKIDEIAEKVAAGEDFAALATELSQDAGSAAKGGDLGFFGKGRMVPEFEKAAFALEPGGTSEVVESPFGFHIIRVDEVREERVRPIDEVREVIVAELQGDQAGEKAKEAADAAHAKLEEGKTFEEVAAEYEMEIVAPPAFAQNTPIPGVGQSFPLTAALFALEAGKHTGVQAAQDDWVVARLEEKVAATTPPLEDVRARVVADLRREEGAKKGREAAEELLARAKELGSLEKAAEEAGRTIETSPSFARSGPYVPGMGMNAPLKNAVFSLSDEKMFADEPFETLGDAIVIARGDINRPTDEELEEKMDETRTAMLQQSRQSLFQRYVEELKAAASIQVNTVALEQLPPV